jgi:hypothetical protein
MPPFLPKYFIVLALRFRSLMHFNFNSWYDVEVWLYSFYMLSQHYILKRLFFAYRTFLELLPILYCFISGLWIILYWCTFLSLCQYYTATILLLSSEFEIWPTLLAILSSLHFHIKLRIRLSAVKQSNWNFDSDFWDRILLYSPGTYCAAQAVLKPMILLP